jgi:hypothetical protein
MSSKSKRFWTLPVLGVFLSFSMTGCDRSGPLVIIQNQPPYAPWCGPNRRVKIGLKVVGRVHDGAKHKEFLVDETGKEHDPEQIADHAWSFLERTGYARKIEQAFIKDSYQSRMPVVSINPVVVILELYPDPSWQNRERDFAHHRWSWTAQIQPNSAPHFSEGLQWFSPELKQRPTKLAFSEAGVAEIRLPRGKIKLVRSGDICKTTRE